MCGFKMCVKKSRVWVTLTWCCLMLCVVTLWAGCSANPQQRVSLAPMAELEKVAAPKVLKKNHFKRDNVANLSEGHLNAIMDAPVYLEDRSRVGILPVAAAYEVNSDVPTHVAPQHLSEALERTGHFDVTTEVSTDWPAGGSVAGLRELAARYRVKYLLLYRHRFVEDEHTNAWGWGWITLVGGLFTPSKTIRASGVLEASLFDVRTGTILFTVQERASGEEDVTLWNTRLKRQKLKATLLSGGVDALSKQVTEKVQRLVVARMNWEEEERGRSGGSITKR